MSKELNIEEVCTHIGQSISKLKNTLESLAISPVRKNLKRASLVSYWIDEYADYISSEDEFNPQNLIKYKCGDIVQVHFGYRVGRELGGLHYAIVLDNNNSKSSPIMTVVPLGSLKKTFRENYYRFALKVDLNGLIKNKADNLIDQELRDLDSLNDELQKLPTLPTEEEKVEKRKQIDKRLKKSTATINRVMYIKAESEKLSHGSIVDTGQIVTISKQRVSRPRNTEDVLYGISASKEDMEKIREKIKKNIL